MNRSGEVVTPSVVPAPILALARSAGLLTLIWIAFAWPWLAGEFTIPWDGKAHFAPQVQFMAASLARGEWPWWTPNVFAGHPQIADPQSMLFSPPFVLLALIDSAPGPWAIDLVVLLMLLAAGLGVLVFSRDLGWHDAAGLIAAIGFAFGAAMAWRLQHFGQVLSMAYLPFALLFLRRAIVGPSVGAGALAGLFAAFIVLGRDQVGLLSIYLLAGYAVTLVCGRGGVRERLRGAWLPLGVGALVGCVLVTIPILLTVALAAQSNRPAIGYLDAAAGSLHPALLITGLAPQLFGAAGEMRDYWGPPSFVWEGTGLYLAQNMGLVYIGALALLLLVIGAQRGLIWAREIRFFTIALGLVLIYGLGWYTPVFRIFHDVFPGVAFYRRPADAVFLVGGLGAIVAGYVAHRLIDDMEAGQALARRTVVVTGLAIAGLFGVAVGFAVVFGRVAEAAFPVGLAAVWFSLSALALVVGFRLAPARPHLAGALLTAVLAADVIFNNGPNGASALPRAELAMLEPDGRDPTIAKLKDLVRAGASDTRRDRIEMVGLGYHWPNTPMTHGLESTLGTNPVRLNHYVAATGAGDTVAESGQRLFPKLLPSYQSPLANLLGLRFIVTAGAIGSVDPALPAGAFEKVASEGRYSIYENPDALPRVLFATGMRRVNFGEIVKTGRWPETDFRHVVLLEAGADEPGQGRPGTVSIVSYHNTLVTLSTESPDGGWVVLNDVWQDWWQGEVDGKGAPVLKANVLFRAIKVPPGRHTVRFVFRPLLGAWRDLTNRRVQLASPQAPRTGLLGPGRRP